MRRVRGLPGSLFKDSDPIHEGSTPVTWSPTQGPTPHAIVLGIRASTYNSGGDTATQSSGVALSTASERGVPHVTATAPPSPPRPVTPRPRGKAVLEGAVHWLTYPLGLARPGTREALTEHPLPEKAVCGPAV